MIDDKAFKTILDLYYGLMEVEEVNLIISIRGYWTNASPKGWGSGT